MARAWTRPATCSWRPTDSAASPAAIASAAAAPAATAPAVTVTVQVYGGDTSFVGVTGQLNVSADGFGAAGFGGPGGDGTGGNARILLHDAGDVDIGGDVTLEAIGWGGDQTNGLSAGSGTGGTAEIWGDTTATTLTVAGITNVNASGLGGVATGPGGVGGSALGGLAHIVTTGGTINLQSDANVNSNAAGGDGDEGGNAQSGAARVIADGGNIAIGGNLTLNSISTGGSGINGGDAIAFIGNDPKTPRPPTPASWRATAASP